MILCGIDFDTLKISKIQSIIRLNPSFSRNEISRNVCEILDWRDHKSDFKVASCHQALKRLSERRIITLPRPQTMIAENSVKRDLLELPIEEPESVSCKLNQLGEINLLKIGDYRSEHARIWNYLLERYHYLGKGPLCGCQIRYLVKSSLFGWIGALAFNSSAWRLKPRDTWIGWNDLARRTNLFKVICNSRFLIHPHVVVKNLASHVLGKSIKKVVFDWEECYGYKPLLLETFVSRFRFKGTCYQASNWERIGVTTGRGRNDNGLLTSDEQKDIYVYPLSSHIKSILCKEPEDKIFYSTPLCSPEDWAESELGGCYFSGDARLTRRVISIARDFYSRPQANIPQACQSRAKTKAAYRFFNNSLSTMESILQSHYKATEKRISEKKVVLAVQDSTSLNYSTHHATEGLGPIGYKEHTIGLHVHDTMAFDVSGTPLGLLDVQCWSRNQAIYGESQKRKRLPIEERESYKWLKSFQRLVEIQKSCPDTNLISVGDRDADIYELMDLALSKTSHPGLLIRIRQDRTLYTGKPEDKGIFFKETIWTKIDKSASSGKIELTIPRAKNRKSRTAKLELRFTEVVLNQPYRKAHLPLLKVWIVNIKEVNPPKGIKALEWMLLTTIEVNTFEQALEKVQWYCRRWGIEVYHRTIKSGCKIEERQLGDASSLKSCLAVDMVVAWRIFHLTHLGRETPDVPCSVFFEEAQWKALFLFKTKNPDSIKKEPTLNEAMRMVASLGGFLGRKCDGAPGTKSLWLGLQRLDDITASFLVFRELVETGRANKLFKNDYG